MKIRNISAVATLAAFVLLSSIGTATAETRDYKTAMEECFFGLLFANEDQRGISLGLNVVSGQLGSYAYTSATLAPDTFCAEKKANTAKFVNEAYPKLIEDIARGEGEYLQAALQLAGCNDLASQGAVSGDIRDGLAGDLASDSYNGLTNADKAFRLFNDLSVSAEANCAA